MPHDSGKPPPSAKRVSIPKYGGGGSFPDSDLNLHSLRSDLDSESNLPPIIRWVV